MHERILVAHLARLSGVPLPEVLDAIAVGDLEANESGSLILVSRASAARWLASITRRD